MRAAFAGAFASAALSLSGCAYSYAGIRFAPGAADPELQLLAAKARAGDKAAQLELGIRYEEGRGLPSDKARAKKLYIRAATDSRRIIHAYSPPAGRHRRGRLIQLGSGPHQPGLAEAKARLERLR